MTSTNLPKTYFYMLYNEINYDSLCKEYYNILTLNKEPQGILKDYTKLINITMPSTNDTYNTRCSIAIVNNFLNNNNNNHNHNHINNSNKYNNLLMLEDLNELTEFLINNDYIIDNSITKLYNNTNNNNNHNSKKLIYSFKITL